jgi:hypothetical protein
MTNLAGETMDARCDDCLYIYIYIYVHMYVRSIVRFRGVRPDPNETPDDRKLTGFG